MTRKFKDAADQLSGQKRGVIFAELEGPWFDPPATYIMRHAFERILPDVFKARPFVELVILGFPGPPFSSGASFPIRNTRIKKRNSSFIARKLVRYATPRQSRTIPYKEFRMNWWQRKYHWEHKSVDDINEAFSARQEEALKEKK
jgi:hypothetical protein